MSGYFTKPLVELRDECARRILPQAGSMKALQIRLVNHDRQHGNVAKQTIIKPFEEMYPEGRVGVLGVEKSLDPAVLIGECK